VVTTFSTFTQHQNYLIDSVQTFFSSFFILLISSLLGVAPQHLLLSVWQNQQLSKWTWNCILCSEWRHWDSTCIRSVHYTWSTGSTTTHLDICCCSQLPLSCLRQSFMSLF